MRRWFAGSLAVSSSLDVISVLKTSWVADDFAFYRDMQPRCWRRTRMWMWSAFVPQWTACAQAEMALEVRHHVVIEKPMALNRAEGERVLHKALEVGRQVFCVMQNRYSPPSIWLKEIVDRDAWARSKWSKSIVFGTGTTATTARFHGRERPIWTGDACLPSSALY